MDQPHHRKNLNSMDKCEVLQQLVSTELTQANIEWKAEQIKSIKYLHCTSEVLRIRKIKEELANQNLNKWANIHNSVNK